MAQQRINQSSLTQIQKCPEQYRRRWIEGDVVPPGIALHRGTAVHVGVEVAFKEKLTSRKNMKPKTVVEAAVAALETRVREEGVAVSQGESKDALVDTAREQVVALADLAAQKIIPAYQPIAVEETYELALPNDVVLHGRLDVDTEEKIIPDAKTSEKPASVSEFDASPQATTYSLLYTVKHKEPPQGVAIEHLRVADPPRHTRIMLVKGKEDFAALLNLVDQAVKLIRAGAFPGAYGTPGAWWCSPKWCGYWGSCPFVPAHKRNQKG